MMMKDEIKAAIEAVLFVRSELVIATELADIIGISIEDLDEIIKELINEYHEAKRGIQIAAHNDGYLMSSSPLYADILNRMQKTVERRLSPAAMETIAIIAYKQPISRAEIETIRGVRSDRIIGSLLEKGIIKEVGYKQVVGKPKLYQTTSEFLRLFNIDSLKDLPDLEVITNGRKID